MKSMTIGDIVKILCMKQQLLTTDAKKLAKVYLDDEDGMIDVVAYSLDYLLDNEEAFFYLDDRLVDSALYIVGEIKDVDKKNSKVLNSMIPRLNSIKYLDKELKISRLVSYVEYESDLRKIIPDLYTYLDSVSYDATLMYYLTSDTGVEIDLEDKEIVLSCVNYLINAYPAIFKNEHIKNRIEAMFELINKKTTFQPKTKKYLRYTKNEYEKIEK